MTVTGYWYALLIKFNYSNNDYYLNKLATNINIQHIICENKINCEDKIK